MVTQLESYSCSVCQGIFIGSYENALAHEKIPIDTPLPMGLVLRVNSMYEDTYAVIFNEGKLRKSELIKDNEFTHDYIQSIIRFYVSYDKKIVEHFEEEKSSRLIKKQLQLGRCRVLSQSSFSDFLTLYDKCHRIYTHGLDSSDLIRTNKKLNTMIK